MIHLKFKYTDLQLLIVHCIDGATVTNGRRVCFALSTFIFGAGANKDIEKG